MLIGFTYDLRADYLEMGYSPEETGEFDSEETIIHLQNAIESFGHKVVRIGNIYSLSKRLIAGERWDMVFNICEGMYGRSREAQVPALLEAYNIPYTFSDPLTLAVGLDKQVTKKLVRQAGIKTPEAILVQDYFHFRSLEASLFEDKFDLFVKPNHEGTGKGIDAKAIAHNMAELTSAVRRCYSSCNQPVLIEKSLPGREYTVGVIGTGTVARAVGMMEIRLLGNADPNVYTFMNKELCEERVKYIPVTDKKLLTKANAISLKAYNALGCRDAGRVDLKENEDGELEFLEINPLPGLHPTHSDLPMLCAFNGMDHRTLIGEILHSAILRAEGGQANEAKGEGRKSKARA